MYDLLCDKCGEWVEDRLEPVTEPTREPHACGGTLVRALRPGYASGVVGDECDVTIKHGLCNPDGTPRRYTSKAEIAREAERRGMTNYVVHRGSKGGDKSKHTSRWI